MLGMRPTARAAAGAVRWPCSRVGQAAVGLGRALVTARAAAPRGYQRAAITLGPDLRARAPRAAMALSDDHKPNRADERSRIEAAGGVVVWAGTWRVGGVLAVSRAFGDRLLKRCVPAASRGGTAGRVWYRARWGARACSSGRALWAGLEQAAAEAGRGARDAARVSGGDLWVSRRLGACSLCRGESRVWRCDAARHNLRRLQCVPGGLGTSRGHSC